jgi:hypothetical protein
MKPKPKPNERVIKITVLINADKSESIKVVNDEFTNTEIIGILERVKYGYLSLSTK